MKKKGLLIRYPLDTRQLAGGRKAARSYPGGANRCPPACWGVSHFRRLALREDDFPRLAYIAKEEGIFFLSTPFYSEAVDLLHPLVPAFKIASGDITFYSLLEHVAKKNKPILLSTGMSTVEEIAGAIAVIEKANPGIILERKLLILHCVSAYPAKIEEANLRSIPFLKEIFKVPTGYSDHTLGLEACLYAVALGACLVEKHFTLDKNRSTFRDHQLSADPEDMRQLVTKIRLLEKILGEYDKKPVDSEIENRRNMRRGLTAKKSIPKGTIIKEDMLLALRPEKGIPASFYKQVIGKKVQKEISEGQFLDPQNIEDFTLKNL